MSKAGADLLITASMLVLDINILWMLLDEETTVHWLKGLSYSSAQLAIAYANFSVGLYMSSVLILIGAVMWVMLSFKEPSTSCKS